MTIFVSKVHPINFPFLWAWTWVGRVAYWRSQFIPERRLRRFQIVDPQELMTRAEWLEVEERAHALWTESVSRWNDRFRFSLKISGVRSDFTDAWFQWLAIEVRDYVVFEACADLWRSRHQKGSAPTFILGTPLSCWFEQWNLRLSTSSLRPLPFSRWLDTLFVWLFALKSLQRLLFPSSSMRTSKDFKLEDVTCVWTGVGEREIPSGPGKLDFSFLTRRGVLEPRKCLYVVPCPPSPASIDYLAKENVTWIEDQSFVRLFPKAAARRLKLDAISTTLRACFSLRNRLQLPVLLHLALRGLPWIYLKRASRFHTYICSISAFFPARPEISVLNSVGVRTINWTFSTNDFLFLPNKAPVSHRITHFSIPVTQEVWVWNSLQTRLQKRRRHPLLNRAVTDKFTGPLMCGDSRLLQLDPAEVRMAHGIGSKAPDSARVRYLSAFDIAVPSRVLMRQGGVGPDWITLENLEHFYRDLIAVLERHGNLRLLLKAKRALGDSSREYPPAFLEMIRPEGTLSREGRVIFLDHDVDPYLPIAAADYSIGLPFSSPVLAAVSSNRAGRFYDPDGCCTFVIPEELEPLIVRGKTKLSGEMEKWLNDPERYVDEQRKVRDSELWMGPGQDPVTTFGDLLHASHPGDSEKPAYLLRDGQRAGEPRRLYPQ